MFRPTGLAKRIQEVQPKAHPTHCYAHSLSFSVKDMTCNCKLLSQTMDIAKEIVTLITKVAILTPTAQGKSGDGRQGY